MTQKHWEAIEERFREKKFTHWSSKASAFVEIPLSAKEQILSHFKQEFEATETPGEEKRISGVKIGYPAKSGAHSVAIPTFTVRDEEGKEVASLLDNGMVSVSKFGYSADTTGEADCIYKNPDCPNCPKKQPESSWEEKDLEPTQFTYNSGDDTFHIYDKEVEPLVFIEKFKEHIEKEAEKRGFNLALEEAIAKANTWDLDSIIPAIEALKK